MNADKRRWVNRLALGWIGFLDDGFVGWCWGGLVFWMMGLSVGVVGGSVFG